jgi:hypothetical protein
MFSPLTECYFLFTTLENSMAQLILSIFGLLPFFLPAIPDKLFKLFVAIGCSLGVVGTSGLLIIGQGIQNINLPGELKSIKSSQLPKFQIKTF